MSWLYETSTYGYLANILRVCIICNSFSNRVHIYLVITASTVIKNLFLMLMFMSTCDE